MKNLSRLLFVLLLWITACDDNKAKTELPFYNTPDFTPVWLTPTDAGYKNIHTIAPFNLINQRGDSITNKNTAGKIYVANFFFTSCQNICPPMMEN